LPSAGRRQFFLHRFIVEAHHWMTSAQFAELYTLAQIAPGPNAMYVTLAGWQLAGWTGVAATTLPLLVPAAVLTLPAAHLSERHKDARVIKALRYGLLPIAIGLTFASSFVLMRAVNHNWRAYLITAATVVLVMRTKLNPLSLLAGGAVAGIAGLV
jgi:chromate transporter